MAETVCVTGATGFIAGHIIQQLLAQGHTVRGTVRNPEAAAFLTQLDGASERLTLHTADLTATGAFDDIVAGCTAVYHIASPVPLLTDVDPEWLNGVSTEGTLNVLRSAAKAPSVKRVVITASFATIIFAGYPERDHTKDNSIPYTDKDWNEYSRSWPGERGHIYRRSKVLAEKAAWQFVEDNTPGFVLCTIHPPMVVGPSVPGYTRFHDSGLVVGNFISGETAEANAGGMGWIDVRDVARAHILAGSAPGAKGRYLVYSESHMWKDICGILKELFPEYPVTTGVKPGDDMKPLYDIRRTNEDLGYKPEFAIRDSLAAQGAALIAAGHVKKL